MVLENSSPTCRTSPTTTSQRRGLHPRRAADLPRCAAVTLGGAAFGFLVPALAGYIAYAIADRPGIAPGFVMGAVAGVTATGFIGGIIGGVLAGWWP